MDESLKKFAKIFIAGGLGWVILGPIGGIIALTLGLIYENADDVPKYTGKRHSTAGDFGMSLVVLVAVVMKADGKVLKSELNYVKQFFKKNFGEEVTSELLLVLRDVLKQEISLTDVCLQMKYNMDYSSRLELLHLLFGLANVDGKTSISEAETIKQIGQLIGISQIDLNSVTSMFTKNNDANYQILGVTPETPDDEIKKAFRQMAAKYHPDKLSYLGEDFQRDAKEKFQKINNAYQQIKKERGF